MSLKNKRVVIIGGTSGIGLAVAEAAMRDGAAVVAGSSGEERIATLRSRLPQIEAQVVDVRDEASVARFFEQTGAFDHLVFTAGDWGAARGVGLEALDRTAAESLFTVRFWGAFTAVKQAQRHIRTGGSIVLTDGMIAHRPRKGSAVSTAMAGAIEHLTRGLAVELAPIRVNAVCPGGIRTDIWNAFPPEQREERLRRMTERLPIPRIGEPEEVAEAYLYLLRGGYTTGQVLFVDGGMSVI